MTTADGLRQRAREIENHSWVIRFTNPMESRALRRLAGELMEMANNLNPDPRSE